MYDIIIYLSNAIVHAKNSATKFELEHFMKFYLICGKLTILDC